MKGKIVPILLVALELPVLTIAQQERFNLEQLAKQEMARYRWMGGAEGLGGRAPAVTDSFDVLHYDLDLEVDPTQQTVGGTVTAWVRVGADSIVTLSLDLRDEMTVYQTRRDSVVVPFTHSGHLVTAFLDRTFLPGETLSVAVDYNGHPPHPGFSAFTFGTHGGSQVAIYSLSEPDYAKTWWPCKDVPSDKTTASIKVTVPDTLVVASNGTLLSITDLPGNKRRYYWEEQYPIATYLISLAISNYSQFTDYYHYSPVDSMPVDFFVYPEDLSAAQVDFDVVVPMMEFYGQVFGEYPFINEKYGMAEFGFFGGMEHQTCTSYGEWLIRGDHWYDWVVAHELSHQWWGDALTPADWRDIWINEGFATYSEALWVEHNNGSAAYRRYMIDYDDPSGFAGSVYDPIDLFGDTVYQKGAWVLHMLRHVMGDGAFFAAMLAYATDPTLQYGNSSTADFQRVCETFYGGSLDWFFLPWVYGEGRPDYQYSWTQYRVSSDYVLSLRIEQVQTNGNLFVMPIDIKLTLPSGDTTLVVWDDGWNKGFNFVLPESVLSLAFDPEDWILKYSSEVPTAIAAGVAPTFDLRVSPNPFYATTSIRFRLPQRGPVDLEVYSVDGARVATIFAGNLPEGEHAFFWTGGNRVGGSVQPGVYFLRLRAPEVRVVQKLVLIR